MHPLQPRNTTYTIAQDILPLDDRPTSKKVTVDGIFCYKQNSNQNVIGICLLWKAELLLFVFFYLCTEIRLFL